VVFFADGGRQTASTVSIPKNRTSGRLSQANQLARFDIAGFFRIYASSIARISASAFAIHGF